MIAVQDDAAGYLTNSAKRALLSLGAGRDEVAALGMHKQASFALIGRKGAAPGSVPQVFVRATSRWMWSLLVWRFHCRIYRIFKLPHIL